jgi:hypothetical protein
LFFHTSFLLNYVSPGFTSQTLNVEIDVANLSCLVAADVRLIISLRFEPFQICLSFMCVLFVLLNQFTIYFFSISLVQRR